ncbi:nitroreductase family deazaflavin-dependent oxidoreductase [Candidatus Chloroploca sp. M-50]|uniref:Nitroreductase family deazaflavin-dependent oxidoreductase n=1 Tax=Candidatus Chloroploca mongolica TaxID=2528176 RepID=A0ABS4DCQ1_9CHLR|nr:nitroreductase/quinone reductase family protein [Candidatus Chloroploca mongolica]MBP1467209.1 nitroreductase family deazaflavin-dependent oxidoreductase [Candidatus Chloroploca mongolica]
MPSKQYAPFRLIMQKIAASSPGSWYYARTLHFVDGIALRLSGGRLTMTSLFTGLPVVSVTTTGAKSGLPRTVPLLCIRDERDPANFAIIATNWGQKQYPAWYFNLKANPRATCSLTGKTGTYLAHEAVDEEYARFWQYASNTYFGYPLYKQRIHARSIPIMVMTPDKL